MASVAEIIGLKTPTPTALDTAGIRAQWSQRLREQALFSARMTLQGYLDRVQTVLMQVADGTLDTSAARLALTDKLAELGYTPEPGTAGTLRDARTLARLNLVLKTNRQTAASLAQLAESEDPQVAALFPAWELASGGYRKQHRTDWPQRWKAAGERVAWQGAHRTKMVALKSSPIWQALGDGAGGFRDTLGNPYPPFAFGSSYEWVPVDRLEAKELGLLGEATNRAARRAAALLITALTLRAIRNRNEIDHCPKDGTILTKEGKCNSSRHSTGDEPEKDASAPEKVPEKKDAKQSTSPKHGGVKGKSVTEGYKGRCSQEEAEALLREGVEAKDGSGFTVSFGNAALTHYRDGHRRKDNTPKPENLRWLPAAIHAVKHGARHLQFPKRTAWDVLNPPRGTQYVYTESFGNNHAIRVYAFADTGKVSGWHMV